MRPGYRPPLICDVLFVGLTRPALAFGVPYAALLLNAMLTLELFLLTRNLLCILFCLPLHGLTWLACLSDPRFFELIALWGQVRVGTRHGRRVWGTLSYSGLSVARKTTVGMAPRLVVEHALEALCPA